ncbi:MAG TPA: PASTA domain-containing protein [Acidimicrobiia bacterium]|nr:PASTA domain-containing protein [Acidimicrobiia bacterium]
MARTPGPRLKVSRDTSGTALGVNPGDSAAYATGTVVHADALRSGTHSLADLDVAFSGAAFSSAAGANGITNEVNRLVTRKLAANAGYGRGTGLELGLASDPFPLIGQLSQAAAPPSTNLIERVVGPIGVPGLLSVDLLRSQAQSRSAENACVLGRDQAYGLGSVLNLNVLQGLLQTAAAPPQREVSQSTSNSRIVPGSTPGRLGLRSEVRETIAPVTFFKGLPSQFTVEVLGEWALKTTADGAKASVTYGPLSNTPETPVLRIIGDHGQVITQLTTQQLLTDKGLEIKIPGVAEIVVGEDARAIDGDASTSPVVTPTLAAAAVDVVRVKLLNGQLADVRVGHMETAVAVPAGGVQCPGVKVTQTVEPPAVTPGGDFTYTITVTNPNDCDLTHVKVVETPTVTPSTVKYTIVSATPAGAGIAGGSATWNDIGPLAAGETKTLTVKVTIPADSSPGKLVTTAVLTGVCPAAPQPTTDTNPPSGPGSDQASPADIPVGGSATVDGPTVGVCVVPDLAGLTQTAAEKAVTGAGCILGSVTPNPGAPPADAGKVTDQGPKPGTEVPIGTPVDITVGGPASALQSSTCTVPKLAGLTQTQAEKALLDAGCKLGDVTPGPDNPAQAGRITDQSVPAGSSVQRGTEVNVTVAGPACTVPAVTGMSEADARTSVEAQGCVLTTDTRPVTAADQAGKVLDQNPPPSTVVAKGSPVHVTIGVQVLGATLNRPTTDTGNHGGAAAPTLVKTGGVALGGLALWLLISGLLARLAGSERLWNLLRRVRG